MLDPVEELPFKDLRDAVRRLCGQLDTIQILSVDEKTLRKFTWHIASRCRDRYVRAVDSFTGPRSASGQLLRTLAFVDYRSSAYWYRTWDGDGSCSPAGAEDIPIHPPEEYGVVTPPSSDPGEEKLTGYWQSALEMQYPAGGSTFWVTQKHRLQAWEGGSVPPVSAAFCVFNTQVESEAVRYEIARTLQDYLVDHLLRVYEKNMAYQLQIYKDKFRDYLHFDPHFKIVSPSTKKQIRLLDVVILAGYPVLIEGEPGTGKLTTARLIHSSARGTSSLLLVNGIQLRGDADDTDATLIKKGLLVSGEGDRGEFKLDLAPERTVVFDDIHLATQEAQYRLAEHLGVLFEDHIRLPNERGTGFVFTSCVSRAGGDTSVTMSPELRSIVGTFAIRLPTIHERLAALADAGAQEKELLDIVTYFWSRAIVCFGSVPVTLPPSDFVDSIRRKHWHMNYVDLKHAVLREVTKRAGDDHGEE